VSGEVQGSNVARPRRQRNVDSSEAVKVKVGVASVPGSPSVEDSVVTGAVRSIVKVMLAGAASTFPAVSVACTWNV
jgi:hypothetical protein